METSAPRKSPFLRFLIYSLAFTPGILLWKMIPKDDHSAPPVKILKATATVDAFPGNAQASTGWDEYIRFAKVHYSRP